MKVYVCVPDSMLQEAENKSLAIVNRMLLITYAKTGMNYVYRMHFVEQYKLSCMIEIIIVSARKYFLV